MATLINIGLTMALMVIMVLPVLGGYFLINTQSESGVVAGVHTVSEADVSILPALEEFKGYTSFKPQPLSGGQYQDVMGLTVFQRQKAAYRGIYSIYNTSTETLSIELSTVGWAKGSEELGLDRLVVSLSEGEHSQTLLGDRRVGATLVLVADPSAYKPDELVLVGEELTRVVAVSPNGLVVTPLRVDHLQGEEVYRSPIVLSQTDVLNPLTRVIQIAPGDRATVTAVVWGGVDSSGQNAMVELPLTFKIKVVR